jgi:Asp-tRNA(Asn)/Glu-tRNA(Gln) amidotransferase A subunit family amidase
MYLSRHALAILLLNLCISAQSQDTISIASSLFGLTFTQTERDSMKEDLEGYKETYRVLRNKRLGNDVPMALYFNPIPQSFEVQKNNLIWEAEIPADIELPGNIDNLAYYSVLELSSLIRSGKITSEELTRFFIRRLKLYGDTLNCVITLTEDLALKQAKEADTQLKAGNFKGPLHGIPYGVKDLLSVPGYPTTWGARPFEYQIIDQKSTVVQKLEEAGAVLIAKLSLGALAWGDVWFSGKTRNPWNLQQGSSGSSAGSASATAAGLVPFAIGSETWSSIVSPSNRCGTTGLRPTFGRVSRHGSMTLSWSMDKIGPICRSAEDCALVLRAITGPDGKDHSLIDAGLPDPFNIGIDSLRVGFFQNLFDPGDPSYGNDSMTLEIFRNIGIDLIPIEFKSELPVSALSIILDAESAAAFDELTRSGQDDLLVRQIKRAWPNNFRRSRFIPAVEYIQANCPVSL